MRRKGSNRFHAPAWLHSLLTGAAVLALLKMGKLGPEETAALTIVAARLLGIGVKKTANGVHQDLGAAKEIAQELIHDGVDSISAFKAEMDLVTTKLEKHRRRNDPKQED